MNKSERLQNQGNKEDVITPEMELSMQLRRQCESILREKGKISFSFGRILYRTLFLSVHMLEDTDTSVEKVRYRRVVLRGEGDNEQSMFLVACTGINPEKAKYVEIYSLSKPNSKGKMSGASEEFLRLEKDKRGVFMKANPVGTIYSERAKAASTEEILDYQKLVYESSPITPK